MPKPNLFKSVAIAALATLLASGATRAANGDGVFFDSIQGHWSGPGEIVAGKYKGTRFACDLAGTSLTGKDGMSLSGKCRIGVFTQTISATFERSGGGYRGQFLDGAKGKGLDVVSGNVAGDRVVVGMERAELRGAMVARIKPNGKLGVTVSVRVGDDLVPVVGMNLDRAAVDSTVTGSVAN